MSGTRRLLVAILAAAGVLLLFPAAGSAACGPSASMPMMHHAHHQGSTPTNHDAQLCATCVAVLPALQVPATQSYPPFAAYVSPVTPLSGFDPALDPPPPRAA